MTDNKKVQKLSALVSCMTIIFVTSVAAGAEPWQVVTVRKISLEGTLKEGAEFEVRIESKKPKELSGTYFGTTDQASSVVSEITVKPGGEEISFPKQAFSDLANASLQTVSITSDSSGVMKLRFTGGDRGTSYEAEFFIEPKRLVKRTVSYFEAAADNERSRVIKTTTF